MIPAASTQPQWHTPIYLGIWKSPRPSQGHSPRIPALALLGDPGPPPPFGFDHPPPGQAARIRIHSPQTVLVKVRYLDYCFISFKFVVVRMSHKPSLDLIDLAHLVSSHLAYHVHVHAYLRSLPRPKGEEEWESDQHTAAAKLGQGALALDSRAMI